MILGGYLHKLKTTDFDKKNNCVYIGNALRAGGVGELVEGAVAQVKGYQIPAGAEDVTSVFC
jgi:hypothetical protein